jgi:serine/threonine protein kinase
VTDESIFAAALAIPGPADRAAYLDRACAADPALRAEVEGLLAAHAADSPLDRPPRDLARTGDYDPAPESDPDEAVGAVIAGKYKLVERIGEGGMGRVYMAQQTEPVKRLVAVKVIRAGMDSRQVLARFEAERQALAMMDHPNIAKVLDAGTTAAGCPFFVMELVKGVPITKFCDDRRLAPRERLELFVPVCQAIQHAHQKGVIHRDVKPGNVLVALYDGRPVPKVIDFGVAKAAGQPLTDKTLVTGFGAIVGTPEYMSPEQAELNQLDIDTRSDVFALGVLLYELLTGTTPLDRKRLGQAALLEVLRIIREEEPPRPSTRISTSDARAGIAANRSTDPGRLSRLVKGELDWIVMKALEKDRTRRYETANGFAADVQRYLDGEPVQAVPPSLGYRARKWWRKNRTAGLVAVGFVLLVAGAAVVASVLAVQARRAEQVAAGERDKARDAERTATRALQEAEAQRRVTEVTLARSLLRPIGYQTPEGRYDPVELRALIDTAVQPDRVRLECVRQALADPETALRVARRAERFAQAVVGASPARRQAALAIMTPVQHDLAADPRVRLAACWIAVELHSGDWAGFETGLRYLAGQPRTDWHNFLTPAVLAQLDPAHAEAVGTALTDQLLNRNEIGAADKGFGLLAPHMPPRETGRVAAGLLRDGRQLQQGNAIREVVDAIEILAPRLSAADADQLALELLADLTGTDDNKAVSVIRALSHIAPRTSSAGAARVVDGVLAQVVDPDRQTIEDKLARADNVLSTLDVFGGCAARLDDPRRRRIAEVLLRGLSGKGRDLQRNSNGRPLARALAPTAPTITPDEAAGLLDGPFQKVYLEVFHSGHDGHVAAVRILAALVDRVGPDRGDVFWEGLFRRYVLARIAGGRDRAVLQCPEVRERLVPALPRAVARKLVDEFLARLEGKPAVEHSEASMEVVGLLLERLPEDEILVRARRLLALVPSRSLMRDWEVMALVQVLDEAAGRLSGAAATALRLDTFETVCGLAARDDTNPKWWAITVAKGLARLVRSLSGPERDRYGLRAAEFMVGVAKGMERGDRPDLGLHALEQLADAVAGDAARLVADYLVSRLPPATAASRPPDAEVVSAQRALEGLAALAARDASCARRCMKVCAERFIGHPNGRVHQLACEVIGAGAWALDAESDGPLLRLLLQKLAPASPGPMDGQRYYSDKALIRVAARLGEPTREDHLQGLLGRALDRWAEAVKSDDSGIPGRFLNALLAECRDVGRLEPALEHPGCVGEVRAALLRRLEDLRHPPTGAEALARFVRDNPAAAAVLGPAAAVPAPPRRYRTVWEYLR